MAQNALDDDRSLERDLKEMLKDGPNMNDISGPVHGGSMPGTETHAVPHSSLSHAVPPSSIPLSNPEQNGATSTSSVSLSSPGASLRVTPTSPTGGASSKLDSLKAWSINTYKCTRQLISEKLGRSTRTIDAEIESQIELLRDTQRRYINILRLARALTSHFQQVVQSQRALGDAFAEMSQKSPELQEEFAYNCETQRVISKNGETLIGALNFFTSSVNTLCNKTMDDTLQTIKLYEATRVEYDAYRTDMELLQTGPRDLSSQNKIEESKRKFSAHKEKFEKLRSDVSIKLKFLDENKVSVSQRNLFLLHKAICEYTATNHTQVDAITRHFRVLPPSGVPTESDAASAELGK
ncbi:hypothetical protein NP493_128g03038 [Ridgeia piscesae]|uniref:AH domain-containing protein n=1 Tax=Ridgeia piscesae TaxID=27915 RepID=A0AAD9P5L2_RIDPI|nr:hypothetical protein NP493_128g03038 [Ridgeia piscesae]